MQKRIKAFLKTPFMKWVGNPLFLLLLAAGLTIFTMIVSDKSFLVVSSNHYQSDFTHSTFNRLTKGQKLTGEFKATDPNLGILAVRFEQFLRIPYIDEDQLVFRIKEKGAKSWYYQGNFRSGLTFDLPFLPLGFPVIADSKGKTYTFEIESLNGNQKNAVVLSRISPNLVSKYTVAKSELMADKKTIFVLIWRKLLNGIQTNEIIFSMFIYSMPCVLYVMSLFFGEWCVRMGRNNYVTIILLAIIFLDIFILQTNNDLIYVIYMIVWFASMRLQKQEARLTFIVGFILLLLAPICFSMNSISMAIKANLWAYAFITTATLHTLAGSVTKKRTKK